MYKRTRGENTDSNSEMQIYFLFDVQTFKERETHAMEPNLQSSLNLMFTLSKIRQIEETNNTKTTVSHSAGICNSNYEAWSITRNPVLVGHTGLATKSHCNDPPLLKCTIQTKWRLKNAHKKNAWKQLEDEGWT